LFWFTPWKKKFPEYHPNRPFKNQNFWKKKSKNVLLGGILEKNNFTKGVNQNKKITGDKPENDIYYRG